MLRTSLVPLLVSTVAASLIIGTAAVAQVDFDASRNTTPGALLSHPALADFDGDGDVDLIATGMSPSIGVGLEFFRGTGRGTFGTGRRVFTGAARVQGVADFDEDGDPDILVLVDDASDRVAVFLGDGHGYFADAGAPLGGPIVEALAALVVHFEGEPHAGVAVVGHDGTALSVATFRSDGTGFFSIAGQSAFAPGVELRNAISGDIDGDGNDDLVLLVRPSGKSMTDVAVVRSSSTGTLLEPVVARTLDHLTTVAAADFNEDGAIDLAVVAFAAPSVGTLLFGDGAGNYPSEAPFIADGGSDSLVAADLNGDGHVDLLAGYAANDTVALHHGDGAGAFSSPLLEPAGTEPRWVASADLDADGDLDIVALARGGAAALRVEPSGTYDGARRLACSASLFADFDEDGVLDLVSDGTTFRRGDGAFGFGPPVTILPLEGESVKAADLNEDGHLDVISARTSADRCFLTFVPGLGSGGFGEPTTNGLPGDFCLAIEIELGDFDRDGLLDVVTGVNKRDTEFSSGSIVETYSGLGDGTFGTRRLVHAPFDQLGELEVGDFDGAGFLDVAMLQAGSNYDLFVAFGRGDGMFDGAVDPATPIAPRGIAVGDVDGDAVSDIVLRGLVNGSPSGSARVATLHATAARAFEAGAMADIGNLEGNDLVVTDLDQSGRGDVVLTAPGDGCASILLSEPGRALSNPRSFVAGGGAASIVVGDLDGDGLSDLAVNCSGPEDLALLRNETGELDYYRCRRGNVNAGAGPVADVLFLNELAGAGIARRISIDRGQPAEMRVGSPPSRLMKLSPFVLYVWRRAPEPNDGRVLPAGVGASCMPMPFGPDPTPTPRWTWNSIGKFGLLGTPSFPSSPAPVTLFSRASGIPIAGTFFFQGAIVDDAAPNGRASVTNAIELIVR